MTSVAQPAPSEPAPLAERRVILLVDDDVLLRFPTAEYLRDAGFQVLEAASGDEAVALLSSAVVVDLVFSDIQMPGGTDGYGLARWLRDNRPGLPILLTSGDARRSAALRPFDAHWPLLLKPYEYHVLLQRIRDLLDEPDEA